MCRAKHYTEQLLSIFDNIKHDIEQNNLQIQELDNLQQDLLHIIENDKFNAYEGYMLAKKIQEARTARRIIKIEQQTLLNLKNNFCDKSINQLKMTAGNIRRQDEVLMRLTENKVYICVVEHP